MDPINPSTIDRTYPDLVKDLQARQLCIFIGAGFSHNAGYPLWSELMAPIIQELEDDSSHKALYEIAQDFVNRNSQNRNRLQRHVMETIRNVPQKYSISHKFLAALNVPEIFTTNFDTLLEKYAEEHGRPPAIIIEDADIPLAPRDEKTSIIKLNGCISRPTTMVLTTEDFETYESLRPEMVNRLKASWGRSSFLFIGASLRDPTFSVFNSQVLSHLGSGRRPFYTLVNTCTPSEEREYDRRGITPISMNVDLPEMGAHVSKFLECLTHLVKPEYLRSDNARSELGKQHLTRQEQAAKFQKDIIVSRLGTGLSLGFEDAAVDRVHKYSLLRRTDLLDYRSGDFVTIRRLKGFNTSDAISSYLLYCESTERKCTFAETETIAFDFVSQQPLLVEPTEGFTKRLFTHTFRIYFPRPIAPGQEFDIVYKLKLPGELAELSQVDEMMSLSLVRIEQPVSRVEFNVVLNFQPRGVMIDCLDKLGQRTACRGSGLTIGSHEPRDWPEKSLNIDWSDPPFAISWASEYPDSTLYMIAYKS